MGPALKIAGLDGEEYGLRIHKLRHAAANSAIAAGADVVVQTMLGHRNATETLSAYVHLWPDRLDEVFEKVALHRAEALKSVA